MVLHLRERRAHKQECKVAAQTASAVPESTRSHATLIICVVVSLTALLRSTFVLHLSLFRHEQQLIQDTLQFNIGGLSHELTITLVHAISAAVALVLPPMQSFTSPGGTTHKLMGCVYCTALTVAMPTAVALSVDREDAPHLFAAFAVCVHGSMVVGVVQLYYRHYEAHSMWMRRSHVVLMLGFALVQTADQMDINAWSHNLPLAVNTS